MLALIMVLCMIPTTALAVPPGKQSVTIKLAYSDYGYEPTGSKGFTYTFSSPLQGGTGWIYTLGPVEQYVTSQEMSGYTFTGYSVMEKGKRVSKMPGDTWDLGQGNGGMLHVQLQKNNDTPTSSTLQVNTVITGDQTLTSNGTPFPVTVGTGYAPDDYKTGLDNSNYTYTFVKAERNSGKGLFKITASSSNGTTSTDSKYRQFFPASGANVVTVYYTAKSKAAPTPTPPANDDIKGLVGSGNIQVKCITANTTHPIESYSLLDGSYTTGAVTKNGDAYTCTITVDPAKYVTKYNETNGDHTLNPNEQSRNITFEWKNNSWALAAGQNLPIIFTVIHNTQEPPTDTPNLPADIIKELVGRGNIQVQCTTANTTHPIESYSLLDESYTTGTVTKDGDAYTCTITVDPAKYVAEYNKTHGSHTLNPNSQSGSITFKWENDEWTLLAGQNLPITFTVIHNTQEPPTDTPNPPADIKELVGSSNIQVQCTTANTTHPIESYSLLDESYTTGTVTKDGDAYTCTITVDPAKYVAEYNKTHGDHKLNPNPQNGSITFKWENDKWTLLAGQNLPITFTVVHDTQEPPTPGSSENPEPSPSTNPNPTPTPTPGGGNGSGGHYHPTTPVPVIVIPPKTGDMTIWQSILHFLGIR